MGTQNAPHFFVLNFLVLNQSIVYKGGLYKIVCQNSYQELGVFGKYFQNILNGEHTNFGITV